MIITKLYDIISFTVQASLSVIFLFHFPKYFNPCKTLSPTLCKCPLLIFLHAVCSNDAIFTSIILLVFLSNANEALVTNVVETIVLEGTFDDSIDSIIDEECDKIIKASVEGTKLGSRDKKESAVTKTTGEGNFEYFVSIYHQVLRDCRS